MSLLFHRQCQVIAWKYSNHGLDPCSLRYLQGSRVRHGHVLRRQVALRSREEGEGQGDGEARGAPRGRQGGCSLRAIAPGPGARYLSPYQGARYVSYWAASVASTSMSLRYTGCESPAKVEQHFLAPRAENSISRS